MLTYSHFNNDNNLYIKYLPSTERANISSVHISSDICSEEKKEKIGLKYFRV
jgi:hypothetical protein